MYTVLKYLLKINLAWRRIDVTATLKLWFTRIGWNKHYIVVKIKNNKKTTVKKVQRLNTHLETAILLFDSSSCGDFFHTKIRKFEKKIKNVWWNSATVFEVNFMNFEELKFLNNLLTFYSLTYRYNACFWSKKTSLNFLILLILKKDYKSCCNII